jgi:DNA-binding PadR family transcriptional regulator
MPIISNRETALLGLLNEQPMHAYEIEKTIKQRNMRHWTEISFSTLYYELKKLEKKHLVTSKITLSDNNITKKTYTINTEGKKILKQKTIDLLSHIEKIIWQIDLAMANLNVLTDHEAIDAFTQYIKSIDKYITMYQELYTQLKENDYPDSDLALVNRPLMHLRIEKKWAQQYLEGIKNGTKTNWNHKNTKP